MIRNSIFTFLRAVIIADYEQALGTLADLTNPDGGAWRTDLLRRATDAYYADHQRIRLDPAARNQQHTHVRVVEDKSSWRVQQMLVDPDDANDWMVEFDVNLADSQATGAP